MTKLLPCPFCGSKDIEIGMNNDGYFNANCNDCDASSRAFFEREKDKAAIAWNTRYSPRCKTCKYYSQEKAWRDYDRGECRFDPVQSQATGPDCSCRYHEEKEK